MQRKFAFQWLNHALLGKTNKNDIALVLLYLFTENLIQALKVMTQHVILEKINILQGITQQVYLMLNKNSPGLLKKGMAKQSRIKSIAFLACKNRGWYRSVAKWIGKIKNWYQAAAKWIGKIKNWYQVAAKCICKNKDWFQVADSSIGKIIQGLIQESVYKQIF